MVLGVFGEPGRNIWLHRDRNFVGQPHIHHRRIGLPRNGRTGSARRGTVEVLNEEHKVVATVSVATGATFDIEVPLGSHTLIGFPQGTPSAHWESRPV